VVKFSDDFPGFVGLTFESSKLVITQFRGRTEKKRLFGIEKYVLLLQ
jgi:hypothetical protein